jgi:hypothetical protein
MRMSASTLAASAARAPLVSITEMVMKFTGDAVLFTVKEGWRRRGCRPGCAPSRRRRPSRRLLQGRFAGNDQLGRLGAGVHPAMALPLASVGWPR